MGGTYHDHRIWIIYRIHDKKRTVSQQNGRMGWHCSGCSSTWGFREEVAALEMAAKAIEGGEGGAPADEPQTDAETPPGGAESAGDDTEDKKDDNEEERGDWDRFALPESKITEAPHEWLYWVLAIPFIAAFTFTILIVPTHGSKKSLERNANGFLLA